MKKNILLKIIAMVVLNVMVISLGVSSFAAARNPGSGVARPMWNYFLSNAYLFYKVDDDTIACGGTTSTPRGVYAYVKVQLQRVENGKWTDYKVWEDRDHMDAIVDLDQKVDHGYTYQLVITHQAYDANGNLLETFKEESREYIVIL